MYNVVVVGAGQLGSRHMQSIKSTKHKCMIWALDSSAESLEKCKEIYDGTEVESNVESVSYVKKVEDLPQSIDFLLIATGSKPRYFVFKEITDRCIVKNVLFEKVLFQKPEEYKLAKDIIDKKGINAWVNCPRRMYEIYNTIKPYFHNNISNMIVSGGNWGMGCNSIHYIDAFAYMIGCDEYSADFSLIDTTLTDSKRQGYKEIHGVIKLSFSNGCQLLLQSTNNGVKNVIAISSDATYCIINEQQRQCWLQHDNADEMIPFTIPYQSQLTSIVLDQIIEQGVCQLTTYEESMILHLPFITGLIDIINKNGINTDSCPIT